MMCVVMRISHAPSEVTNLKLSNLPHEVSNAKEERPRPPIVGVGLLTCTNKPLLLFLEFFGEGGNLPR